MENEPQISREHFEMLVRESGISVEVINARGYKTITESAALRELGFSRPQANQVPGLLIPIHFTDGGSSSDVYRPDVPRVIEDRRKRQKDGSFKQNVLKYENRKGMGIRLDCPPQCRPMLANPEIPLWITEGQKKADAMASRELCSIDLLGVSGFKGKNPFGGVTFLADWDYIALKGREVRLVFDNDVMVKQTVKDMLERLREHLQRKGAHVGIVYLPHKGDKKIGVDDFLLTATVQELEALIEGPRPQITAAAPMVELLTNAPMTIRRPLTVLDNYAYAAIWPYVRVTKTEDVDGDGNVIKLAQPETVEEKRMLIVRSDGVIYGEGGFESMDKLGATVNLLEIPPDDRLWSTPAVIAYRKGERPDAADIFKRIADIVDRFMDFDRSFADQRTMAEMVACYILATWFLDAFSVIGYLWPNGEGGSGKTQLLMVVADLAYLGQVILSGSSLATLRDMADYGATLAFDDAETIADPNNKTEGEKRALLLAGNRRGNSISVKEPVPNAPWRTRYVNTFCPRLFSAIRIPDPILASRTIIIPLVRTADKVRGGSVVLDYELWPHDRRKLIDDCWALALSRLTELRKYERLIGERSELTGRTLEPWRAILAVAAWLEDNGAEGLWKRIVKVSMGYQGEREETESTNLTPLVLHALLQLLNEQGDVLSFGDVSTDNTPFFLHTKNITEASKQIAEEEDSGIDLDHITSRRIGWILKRLRLRHKREAHTGRKGWVVSKLELQKYFIAFNLTLPEKTSPKDKTSPLAEESRQERFIV
jgi:Domain of unknown function (DUF3854)